MKVRELRAFLETLPPGADDWDVTLEDSSGGVYDVAETTSDAEKRGIWLVGAANGFGDHW